MDDNTFECPNCGAKIYPEMTRCPQCGQDMYPEDEQERQADAELRSPRSISSLGAVLIGWLIAGGIALLLSFIVAGFTTPAMLGSFGKVILLMAGPLGALAGSYVAASIDPPHARRLGVGVGILALPILTLFATHWVVVNLQFIMSFWVILSAGLTILAGASGSWLNDKLTQDNGWKEKWRVRGWEDLLYQDLLRKVRFNGSVADRLIEFERSQDPQASRLRLIQSAIQRWERDNR